MLCYAGENEKRKRELVNRIQKHKLIKSLGTTSEGPGGRQTPKVTKQGRAINIARWLTNSILMFILILNALTNIEICVIWCSFTQYRLLLSNRHWWFVVMFSSSSSLNSIGAETRNGVRSWRSPDCTAHLRTDSWRAYRCSSHTYEAHSTVLLFLIKSIKVPVRSYWPISKTSKISCQHHLAGNIS